MSASRCFASTLYILYMAFFKFLKICAHRPGYLIIHFLFVNLSWKSTPEVVLTLTLHFYFRSSRIVTNLSTFTAAAWSVCCNAIINYFFTANADIVLGTLQYCATVQDPNLAKAWFASAGWCYKWGRKILDSTRFVPANQSCRDAICSNLRCFTQQHGAGEADGRRKATDYRHSARARSRLWEFGGYLRLPEPRLFYWRHSAG